VSVPGELDERSACKCAYLSLDDSLATVYSFIVVTADCNLFAKGSLQAALFVFHQLSHDIPHLP
jgi:hypothetical protein